MTMETAMWGGILWMVFSTGGIFGFLLCAILSAGKEEETLKFAMSASTEAVARKILRESDKRRDFTRVGSDDPTVVPVNKGIKLH
jgi:hypothetical protein